MMLGLYNGFLVVGEANRLFYGGYGINQRKIFKCPHFVENERFLEQAKIIKKERGALRSDWKNPSDAVCFLYMGKLIEKKRIQEQKGKTLHRSTAPFLDCG